MLQEISTVSIGEHPLYYSPPTFSQVERKLSVCPSAIERFLKEMEFAASSVSLDLRILDIANETVSTASSLYETKSTYPNVSYRNPQLVGAYLSSHPEIENFLQMALPALSEYFGSPVNIVLEVMTYSEEGSHDELVGWIQSMDDVAEGLEKLERFEDEWLFEQLNMVGNKFNFNIEFK